MPKLSELYFGDLEAYDEARIHKQFFERTFVEPSSMSTSQLRNNKKFIVTGRKGAGKTAIQMRLATHVQDTGGYLCQFFRFHEDMKPKDYTEITATQQHISYIEAIDSKKLFFAYDYREAWTRIFLHRLAVLFEANEFSNKFTQFCNPTKNTITSIFQGISKSLKIKVAGNMLGLAGEVGFDVSEYVGGEMPISEHNEIAQALLTAECYGLRAYFFIDELVFSRLDAKEDELRARSAMVRDLIRCANSLNAIMAVNNIEIHFICSLRPEVRNLLNEMDSEIGKIVDGRDVMLSWLSKDEDGDTLIEEIFRRKVESSHWEPIDFDSFVTNRIRFGENDLSIGDFLKTNTWGRPRDIVRLLQAISKASPNSEFIGEDEIKAGLDEYSRASLKEILDEIGVAYGPKMVRALKFGISKKTYETAEALWEAIGPHLPGLNKEKVISELFDLGVIQGFLPNPPRYFAAHRGETFLKPHHRIRIHPALWNELSIQST